MSDRTRFTQLMDGKIEVPIDGEEPFLIDMELSDKEELQRNYTQYSKLSKNQPEAATKYYMRNMELIKKLIHKSYPEETWSDKTLETFAVKYGDAMLQGLSIALKWIPKDVYEKLKSDILNRIENEHEEETEKKKN